MNNLRQRMRNFQLTSLKSPYQLVSEVGTQRIFSSHYGAYQVEFSDLFFKFFHTLYFLVIADVFETWSNHKTK